MNDLDLCLQVVSLSRSRQPLRYIWRWISRKPLQTEAWFQRTTNRKWHMGYRMVTWPMTSRDLERSNSWPQYAQSAISRKLLELETSNLVCSFVSGMPSERTNNFPLKWAWPCHVTPTIFGCTIGYPSDLITWICQSLLKIQFWQPLIRDTWGEAKRRSGKIRQLKGTKSANVTDRESINLTGSSTVPVSPSL